MEADVEKKGFEGSINVDMIRELFQRLRCGLNLKAARD